MTSLVKNKAFAIISRSAKSLGNLLDGNNVTEIIVIRHSVWSALTYMYNRNASRHRRGVFIISRLRFPFRGCLIAERNKEHHALFASWRD